MDSRMSDTHATPPTDRFVDARAASLRFGLGELRHVSTTGSTNADLAREARGGQADRAVLVADHQTAGRGRLGREWEDDPECALLVSFRFPASVEDAPAMVMAVGIAARAALDSLLEPSVLAKWPNDLVVVDGPAPGKLAGVLGEFVGGESAVVVVGIGVNIHPIKRQAEATSVQECGGPAEREVVLAALIDELPARLSNLRSLVEELRESSATLGTRVLVKLPGDVSIEGHAAALTDAGHLVVQLDDGTTTVVATGDVVQLRSL